MFWNELRIIEQRIILKNKFWNDLRIVEQKFVLEVPGRTKDIFLNRKVGFAAGASLPGLEICKIKGLDKWKRGWTSKLHSAPSIGST
jgi:hypothetical protein